MLADHEVTRDELFAVGATFTLVAWAFAYVYTVCQAIEPGSFTAAVDPSADRTWIELLFLSFTTLSSTGLSDVVPIKPFARSLVMFEQLAGVAYIAMVVSRLVGLLVLGRSKVAVSPCRSASPGTRSAWTRSSRSTATGSGCPSWAASAATRATTGSSSTCPAPAPTSS